MIPPVADPNPSTNPNPNPNQVIPQWQAHRSEGIEAEADAMGFNLLSYAFTYPLT